MLRDINQEYQRKHSRSPLSSSGRGYITLSPKRSSKNKSSVHERDFGFDCDKRVSNGKAIYKSVAVYEHSNQEGLPVRKEKPFKEIPKFKKNEMVIKYPREKSVSERSISRKRKISVTRVAPKLNRIEGGNRSELNKGNAFFYEKNEA